MVDSNRPGAVEISINRKTKRIYVNIDEICRLRVQDFDMLILNDDKEEEPSGGQGVSALREDNRD